MDYQACRSKQTELEKLFRSDPDTALKGMIDLYLDADNAFNHEVCNGIELWLANEMTDSVKEYLSQQSDNVEDLALAKTFRSWMTFNGSPE